MASVYRESELFFVANGITDADKKKSAFLAGVGPATYALARNLVAPDKPVDKAYVELVVESVADKRSES